MGNFNSTPQRCKETRNVSSAIPSEIIYNSKGIKILNFQTIFRHLCCVWPMKQNMPEGVISLPREIEGCGELTSWFQKANLLTYWDLSTTWIGWANFAQNTRVLFSNKRRDKVKNPLTYSEVQTSFRLSIHIRACDAYLTQLLEFRFFLEYRHSGDYVGSIPLSETSLKNHFVPCWFKPNDSLEYVGTTLTNSITEGGYLQDIFPFLLLTWYYLDILALSSQLILSKWEGLYFIT